MIEFTIPLWPVVIAAGVGGGIVAAVIAYLVRREGKLEDLGERHQQRSRELVQTFECREKGEK